MIKNFRISKVDILNNYQCKCVNADYFFSNMQATINIGKIRQTQEDSVLIDVHPLNAEFKFLALADGMGGLQEGAVASNTTLIKLLHWFEKLPKGYFYSEKKISNDIKYTLYEIDEFLRKNYGNVGTTLSLAIVCNCNTVLINVGDSRIYTYSDNKLEQQTEDQSISWDLYKKGIILKKEDIIFHKEKHLITSKIGGINPNLLIENKIISNFDYEQLFLFSDGVTDILSDKQLLSIIKETKTKYMASTIVHKAINSNFNNETLNYDNYYRSVTGGSDNTSAVVMIKHR